MSKTPGSKDAADDDAGDLPIRDMSRRSISSQASVLNVKAKDLHEVMEAVAHPEFAISHNTKNAAMLSRGMRWGGARSRFITKVQQSKALGMRPSLITKSLYNRLALSAHELQYATTAVPWAMRIVGKTGG